ncbi:phosphatase PAP2 family protein [Acidisoma silvae]|uniref:Phosphatase PAP2 family protein n=1 Tax=Acidisoma silvae TaxID=2802396 RepID=A0A963YN33_9PROT|nr:phosphatase PAP2 family protein [Acidisoma silvae]MCB8873769.1 phosphatase PAP2 family protein [Acidisoma silvae]
MRRGWRGGLGLSLTLLCLILVCILVIDRPLALLMHRLFHHSPWFLGLAAIGQIPLSFAAPGLVVAAIAGWWGWRPRGRGWTWIAVALAVTIAITLKDLLKQAFGRTWPETWTHHNPSLIHDGVYGFWPFHGGEGWSSFPSGHTTAIAAVAGVLWWRLPHLRWLWALLVGLTAFGLVAGTVHFLGDVLAGGLLGFLTGRATLALPFPTEDRPAR